MKAVDTNVLVRALVGDDPVQSPAARAVMKAEVFVTSGVWMETEWVLRSVYGWPRGRVSDAFRKLLGTGTISVTEEAGLFWAIDRYAAGADWADMVHLVDSSRHDAFLTFEHRLDEEAGAASPTRVERLR